MKKQEMNNLVAGVKIQSKKDLAVYTIVGIDLEQGKVILDNGKLYTMGTIQRWYSLYEEDTDTTNTTNTVEPQVEDNTNTEEQEDTDTVAPKFNLGDKVVTNFGVGEVVSVPHLVELDGKVTMSNYRVAIYEDGQRYLFDYKEEQLEAYTEQTTQDTDTTANTSDLQEDTSDLKDTDTQVNEVHEDTDTTTKIEVVEGNTATNNTGKTNTVQPTIQQRNLMADISNLVDLHGANLVQRKEYIGVYKEGYKGCIAMISRAKYGALHIDMKQKIWNALDEDYKKVVSKDHCTGIYDKSRKLFRIKYVHNLDILEVVICTALQLSK